MHNLHLFTSTQDSLIEDALYKIDQNNKKFLIILENKSQLVRGVINDGDLRRMLLSGKTKKDKISFSENFRYVNFDDEFSTLCNLFNDNKVDFLPILKNRKLFNIITKHQFHALLLQDKIYNSSIDFSTFDQITLEHEVKNKPWGFYKSVWLSPDSQIKILTIFPNSELSLQKHSYRDEHWIVVKGEGRVTINHEVNDVKAGKYIYIPKEIVHKVENISFRNNLILSEVQLGSYFGEDDIERYDDKYGRE